MEFKKLETPEELETIKNAKGYHVIFKHNTTCPISKMTRSSFEEDAGLLPEGTQVYFLDLLEYRNISDAIAKDFDIQHESPQLLLIKDGKCILDQSLYNISATAAASAITTQ